MQAPEFKVIVSTEALQDVVGALQEARERLEASDAKNREIAERLDAMDARIDALAREVRGVQTDMRSEF